MLHSEIVTASEASAERWLYALHGIFGAGRNWGTVARRLVESRPEVGVVLVDLREHGASRGLAPPHTIEAAAADVAALAASGGRPAAAVLGHSFGGKVALAYARQAGERLEQLWIVDSTPSPRDEPSGSAWEMLRILRELPGPFGSRDELVDTLVARRVERPIAQWMATNLERTDGDVLVWRFDLDALETLLLDFFRQDLWDVVERPARGLALHFIKARRSSVLDEDAVARLRRLESTAAVHLHEVDGGHWLNAENPDAVIELLARYL